MSPPPKKICKPNNNINIDIVIGNAIHQQCNNYDVQKWIMTNFSLVLSWINSADCVYYNFTI